MRKLSIRERVLLVCLAVVATVSGYIMFFHIPMTQRMESLNLQIAQEEDLETQLENKLTHMKQMQQELNRLSAQENASNRMPEYDNRQAVMVELNSILHNCQEYSVFFQEDQSEDRIFRRSVTMPFTCGNYQQVKEIFQKLHDNPLRSNLTALDFTVQENGAVKATAAMTFYEYRHSDAD